MRRKLSKKKEELEKIVNIENNIGKIKKNLKDFKDEVYELYVWGENKEKKEVIIKGVKYKVDDCVYEGKIMIIKNKER